MQENEKHEEQINFQPPLKREAYCCEEQMADKLKNCSHTVGHKTQNFAGRLMSVYSWLVDAFSLIHTVV